MIYFLIPLLGVALLTAVGIEGMVRWGRRRLMDMPNARSSHTTPTPRGGGLPLVVVTLVAWSLLLGDDFRTSGTLALVAGTALVAIVSWIDDLRGLPFRVRLLSHVVAALLVLLAAHPPISAPLAEVGTVPLGFLAWPLAVIWIAGLANAYNFMDGINGIAGGQGLVAAIAWTMLGFAIGSGPAAMFGAILAVACAVFLLFNWTPARIFMGDVGSATLGFLFAALPFVFPGNGNPESSLWVVAAAVVWPFVFDSGFTLVRRWRRGEKLTDAHRSHLYQRLVIAGWSHAATSLMYIVWAATTAGAGWAMTVGLPWSGTIGLSWAVVSGILVWQLTLRVERGTAG